jgi:hypothetical protein
VSITVETPVTENVPQQVSGAFRRAYSRETRGIAMPQQTFVRSLARPAAYRTSKSIHCEAVL